MGNPFIWEIPISTTRQKEKQQRIAAEMGLFDCILVSEDGGEFIEGEENGVYPIKNGYSDFSVVITTKELGFED